MKKNIRVGFIWILGAFQLGCAQLWADTQTVERTPVAEVRVMSWNILYKGWEKGKHASWEKRVHGVVQILRQHQPDVVGLQEDSKDQVAYITNALGDYSYMDQHQKKGGGLLIRTEAWKVIESGKILIPRKRQASWVLLESTRNSKRWLFYNAHFVHRTAENSAADRMEAAVRIAEHMASYAPEGVPVVMTGDFNALHDMPCMCYLGGEADSPVKFSNAFNLIHGAKDPRGTFRGIGSEHHCERIDHILVNEHVTEHDGEIIFYDEITGDWPSDHYPVQVTLSTGL